MKNNVDKLRELEEGEKYVFHGSIDGEIEEFEPRQSMSHGKNDGDPSISASHFLDPSLFMAIFSRRVHCGWNATETSIGFYLKEVDYLKAKSEGWVGYVYVFNRSEFELYRGWEWRAFKKLKPLKKYEVSFEDLPDEIDLT